MKAFAIDRFGDQGSIHDLPIPDVTDDGILIRVVAACINPIDWKIREGIRGDRTFPLILGQDFAGQVVTVGARVQHYAVNDRVFGTARTHGAFADYTVVPQESPDDPVAKIPDDVGDADAAALPTPGLTALASLDLLRIGKGETLLINGASGAVGSIASQIARARGATVIGTVHSGKEHVAQSMGVEVPIPYDRVDVVDVVSKQYPAGIDALLDLVSDAEAIKHLGTLVRRGGTVVSTLYTADIAWFEQRGVTAVNVVLNKAPQSGHSGLRELAKLVETGIVRVTISEEHDLRDAAVALDRSKSGKAGGKIVLYPTAFRQ